MKNSLLLLLSTLLFSACTTNTVELADPDTMTSGSKNTATVLIGVDGSKERAVRHLVIGSNEAPLDYELYFHDKKISEGFIAVKIPAPSTNITLKEYSLSGHYGCSRGKAGYGSGSKSIAKIVPGRTYYLGTINTDMNTVYNEMPKKLINEAKRKYNYTAHGEDIAKKKRFQSSLSL
ncbi:hypothetical protein [Sulfurovum riftiae]|uniref:Lipoprotein n=1 Tax=Sulfurovum riftiae TaxID=1630136 RepID=A0A151CEP4_9BACT|nr:hypothetical protein [Sulfurovum riftiae]KYJ86002.1 hypothetical protein AS592_05300 [Sulfurovum riftiae]